MSAPATNLDPGQGCTDIHADNAGVNQLRPVHASKDTHAEVDGADSLRDIVRAYLAQSEEADPRVIARAIAADLPTAAVADALLEGVHCVVASTIRAERSRAARDAPQPSAKWDNVREAVATSPDIFMRRYKTPDGWKFLGDFTKADAEWNRDEHAKLASALSQRATAFDLLAERLRPKGLLRDQLKAEQVEEIFNA